MHGGGRKRTVGIIENTNQGKERNLFEDEKIRKLSEKQHKHRTAILSRNKALKNKKMKSRRKQLLRAIKKRNKGYQQKR